MESNLPGLTTWKEILSFYSRIHSWSEPEKFRDISDVDFDERNQWLAALREMRGMLVPLLCIWIAYWGLIGSAIYEIFHAKNLFLAAALSLTAQYAWALISALVHDRLHSKPFSTRTIFRSLRTWALICPFGIIPGHWLACVLWWVAPINLKARMAATELIPASGLLIGRYWHYTLALIGVAEGGIKDGFRQAALIAIYRRTQVFDMVAAELSRYFVPAIVGLLALFVSGLFSGFKGDALNIYVASIFFMTYLTIAAVMNTLGIFWMQMVEKDFADNPAQKESLLDIPGDQIHPTKQIKMSTSLHAFRFWSVSILAYPVAIIIFGIYLYTKFA